MRRFWAFIVMMLTLVVAIAFNLQSVYESNNLSLEYDGGTETVFRISQREGGISLKYDDISTKISNRLDTAGARNSNIEIDMLSASEANVRVSLSASTTAAYNNVVRLVSGNLPLTFTTANDFEVKGTELYGDLDVMSLTYNNTTPVVAFNVDDTTVWDNLVADAKKASEESLQTEIFVWQNKSDTDNYDNGIGDNKRDDIAKKIIATLSTDNYKSDTDGNRITVATDESGNAFTIASARSYVNARNAGDYAFDIVELYSNTIEATYSTASMQGSLIASGVACAVIWALFIVLFKASGLIAGLSVGFGTMFTMFIANLLGFEFTPVTILAGLITVGLGSFIVNNYFTRIKEELEKGKTIDKANYDGYRKSFALNLEACAFVFFTALFTFLIGEGLIKIFAGVLVIGAVSDFLIVNYFTKWLEYWLTTSSVFSKENRVFGFGGGERKVLKAFCSKAQLSEASYKKRRIASYSILGAVCLAAAGLFLGLGLTKGVNSMYNYQADYSSGYRIDISYVSDRKVSDENSFTTFDDFKQNVCVDNYTSTLLSADNIASYTFNRLETKDSEDNETYTTYISVKLVSPMKDTSGIVSYFVEQGTSMSDMIPVEYQSETTATYTQYQSGNIVKSNFYQYLTIGLIPVFLFAFVLLCHGLYAALAALYQSSVLFGTGMIMFACGLPFNSLAMFGLMAFMFISLFAYLPLFCRYREIKKDSPVRLPSLSQKMDYLNSAKAQSLSQAYEPYLIGAIFGLALICGDVSNFLSLGIVLLVLSIIGFFFQDQLLAFNYFGIMHTITFRPLSKGEKKAKPAFEANEPHETLVPGVND